MNFAAPPPAGASINDVEAINAIITDTGVYGEAGRISCVGERLVVTAAGIAVCFKNCGDRVHECHQAVIPRMRGKAALEFMRDIADWWWETQPSDLMIAAVPHENAPARFATRAIGFSRDGEIDAPDRDGIVRRHIIYKMERPQ